MVKDHYNIGITGKKIVISINIPEETSPAPETMLDRFRSITKKQMWKHQAHLLLEASSFSSEYISNFHSAWIESGHHIRTQIGDDALLVKLLRHILPKYKGGDLTLYRGENLVRWQNCSIGLCWTTSIEVGRMFGSGINSVPVGGLLLQCDCKTDWIISAPNWHSKGLNENEYTVDSSLLSGVKIIGRFPSVDN